MSHRMMFQVLTVKCRERSDTVTDDGERRSPPRRQPPNDLLFQCRPAQDRMARRADRIVPDLVLERAGDKIERADGQQFIDHANGGLAVSNVGCPTLNDQVDLVVDRQVLQRA